MVLDLVEETSPETLDFVDALPSELRGEVGCDDFNYAQHAAELFELFRGDNRDAIKVYVERLRNAEKHFERSLSRAYLNRSAVVQQAAQEIESLRTEVGAVARTCATGRENMNTALQRSTERGCEAVELSRKLRFLSQIVQVVDVIDRLRQMEQTAIFALNQGDLAQVQALCKEFDVQMKSTPTLASALRGDWAPQDLTCLDEISRRIATTAVETLRKVHSSLQSMCFHFNGDEYEEVLHAYEELGAGRELVDRLFSEYERAILSVAIPSGNVTGKAMVLAIADAFARHGDILISFHRLLRHHSEADMFQKSLRRQLQSKTAMLWLSIDKRACELVATSEATLSVQKPHVLSTAYNCSRRLTALGRGFASGGDESPSATTSELLEAMRRVARRSLEAVHKQNLELMGVMLRNETWQQCQVDPEDLRSIRRQVRSPFVNGEHFEEGDRIEATLALLEGRNLVRSSRPREKLEGIPPDGPSADWGGSQIFTPSSLATLRWVSSYLQIGKDFPQLSIVTADAAADLFLLYTHTLTELCRPTRTRIIPSAGELDNYLSENEQAMLRQLRNRYRGKDSASPMTEESWNPREFFSKAFLSRNETSDNLLSYVNLLVAAESMCTLKDIVEPLGQSLPSRIKSGTKRTLIHRLFVNTLQLANPIRKAVYRLMAVSFGGGADTISSIAGYSYDLKEEPDSSRPSDFVNLIVLKFRQARKGSIHPVCAEVFWPLACRAVLSSLVRGFSRTTAVSIHGIGQMLIDARWLESGLEKETGLSPVPGASRAHCYVKAFYFSSESELRSWFQSEGVRYRFRVDEVANLACLGCIGAAYSVEGRSHLRDRVTAWFAKYKDGNFGNIGPNLEVQSLSTNLKEDSRRSSSRLEVGDIVQDVITQVMDRRCQTSETRSRSAVDELLENMITKAISRPQESESAGNDAVPGGTPTQGPQMGQDDLPFG